MNSALPNMLKLNKTKMASVSDEGGMAG